jgi:hypothetical protein
VERYSATLPRETGLQQAINRGSSPDLWMCFKGADGKIMTESKALTTSPTDFQTISMSIKQIPSKSQVYKVKGRQMVMYSGALQVGGKTMGQLYIEQDMTFAVILGCADSRVPPEIVFDEGLGDLFVIRVAGNILDDGTLASIEFATRLGAVSNEIAITAGRMSHLTEAVERVV